MAEIEHIKNKERIPKINEVNRKVSLSSNLVLSKIKIKIVSPKHGLKFYFY